MILSDFPAIILVRPQLGENIGAVARAMKNFGLGELRIVMPRDGWPNIRANAMAVGAVDIIEKARVYNELTAAIADIKHLYATSGCVRTINKDYICTTEITKDLNFKQHTAILFGCESSGLTNEEMALANKVITVHTNPEFTSLNIAQAVLIICYEIFYLGEDVRLSNQQKLATKDDLRYFYSDLFDKLERKKFFRVQEKRKQMQLNIINLFSRIDNLSKSEIQTLRGIINCLSGEK